MRDLSLESALIGSHPLEERWELLRKPHSLLAASVDDFAHNPLFKLQPVGQSARWSASLVGIANAHYERIPFEYEGTTRWNDPTGTYAAFRIADATGSFHALWPIEPVLGAGYRAASMDPSFKDEDHADMIVWLYDRPTDMSVICDVYPDLPRQGIARWLAAAGARSQPGQAVPFASKNDISGALGGRVWISRPL